MFQVTVSIESGNSDNLFQVDYDWTTNTAELRQNGPVDRETDSLYNMSIQLTDSDSYLNDALTATEYMQVYVSGCNDNYPLFNPQVYAVEVCINHCQKSNCFNLKFFTIKFSNYF